jgi:thioredoxin reductase (NADPH)
VANPPVILVVDDDPRALASLLDALVRRYGSDYRLVSQLSPDSALAELKRLGAEGEEVALVIAPQRMAEMQGIDLLSRAHEIHPSAQRALIVEWGDRAASETILHGCAFDQLDNYLHEPWSPPELYLYPFVNEFLSDWMRAHGPRLELVRVVGDEASPRTVEIREFLARSGIPHGFYAAESEEGGHLLHRLAPAEDGRPVIFLLDGRALVNPSNAAIADALGATDATDLTCDVAIVGAGPAGLAAAVYAASEGLRTIVVEREAVGGQAAMSPLIRNYLGFPRGISGAELAQRAYQQAWLFGAKYVFAREVTALRAGDECHLLILSDGTEIRARSVIIATGAAYRRLGIPALDRLERAGVFYTGVVADPRLVKGMHVFVAGGGNAAGQATVSMAKSARRVTLLVRGDSLAENMSDYLVQQIERLPYIEVRVRTEVVDGAGQRRLERLVLRNLSTGATESVEAQLLLVLIGAQPHTDWLAGVVEREEEGFILTGRDLGAASPRRALGRPTLPYETSLAGVFAVGDVRAGSLKRAASAVGEGAGVVHSVHEFLAAPASVG